MTVNPMSAAGFVMLSDVCPDIIQEIRYFSSYNFIGERIDGYEQPVALLSREAAESLRSACDALRDRGYMLKVFDAYRPQRAVDHFARWAEDASDTRMKRYFYPDVDKSRLFELGFIAKHSGHSRGSTVDVTLFDMARGGDADMGGPFDWFGPLSHSDRRQGLTRDQADRRMLLRQAMETAGFRPIQSEWWHFTLKQEPWPDTYFTFPVSEESLRVSR